MQQFTIDSALNQMQQAIAANARGTRVILDIPPLRITTDGQLMRKRPVEAALTG